MSPASETMRASQEMQGTSYISNGLVSTIRLLWSRWPLLLVCALLAVAASVTAAVLMKPVYRATTVLSPVSQDRAATRGLLGELAGFAAAAGVDVGSDNGSVEESLAVFRSRRFTESFIADLGLKSRLLPDKRPRSDEAKRGTATQAYEFFDREVRSLTRDTRTGLVTLSIDWTDRHEAAAWANELVRRINLEMRQRAIDKADLSLESLEAELAKTPEVGTRDAIYRLIENQIRQRMLANVTEEFAFRVIDPAVAPEEDAFVRPRRLLLLACGPFVGLAVGIAIVIFMAFISGLIDALKAGPTRGSGI